MLWSPHIYAWLCDSACLHANESRSYFMNLGRIAIRLDLVIRTSTSYTWNCYSPLHSSFCKTYSLCSGLMIIILALISNWVQLFWPFSLPGSIILSLVTARDQLFWPSLWPDLNNFGSHLRPDLNYICPYLSDLNYHGPCRGLSSRLSSWHSRFTYVIQAVLMTFEISACHLSYTHDILDFLMPYNKRR